VVEVIEDDGYSGATRDRPGISRIMELAEAGQIDAVVAIKRDRFFRSRLYRLLMDEDLKEHGVKLVALNDTNNCIGDGVQDDFAEWEREQIAERTANGKLHKSREGKVVGGRRVSYGYRYVRNEYWRPVGYAVDEPKMDVVRRIFSEIADGTPVFAR